MPEIKGLRKKLDAIDAEVVRLIARRLAVVGEITKIKATKGDLIKDPAREREVLARIEKIARENNISAPFTRKLFREIISHTLAEEARQLEGRGRGRKGARAHLTVAFQGIENAYSHLAGMAFFDGKSQSTRFVGHRTFREALAALKSGTADRAILPIENTTAGSINEVYDLLIDSGVFIVGEETWKIELCLVGFAGTTLEKIRRVYSHPMAQAQCGKFLATLPAAAVKEYFDTAEAVKKIAEDKDRSQAAIASPESAEAWKLSVLQRGIGDQDENYTRFVVLAREPESFDVRIPCKTSIVFSTRHEKGALVKCLEVLTRHGLSMTKLESRPRPHRPWEYLFYMDVEGNIADPKVTHAFDEFRGAALFVKALGSYPAKAVSGENDAAVAQVADADTTALAAPEIVSTSAPPVAKSKNYKLVSRAHRAEDTVIRIGDLLVGADAFVVMAGPCSVESREQIMATVKCVKEHGAHVLRGGVFKPRTSPYSFQGLGMEGLRLLVEAGRHYGLPVITEVMAPEDVAPVAERADILQIGARNMQNFSLLRETGKVNRPVLLKRGMMSTFEELLGAAEYILSQGNGQVMLCERGIRTFETSMRNTLDLTAVPVLRELTHLPIIVDPSHGVGKARFVGAMSVAARAAGAQGLLVEVHPDPAKALSDGDQSLTFAEFADLMKRLRRLKV